MTSSDSEGFESADEGQSTFERRERKHRKSSSNYSDNALETAPHAPTPDTSAAKDLAVSKPTDGWDDFDIEEPESSRTASEKKLPSNGDSADRVPIPKPEDGWDDFDDWGDEGASPPPPRTDATASSQAAGSPVPASGPSAGGSSWGSSWGWGWGVDSLLSQATAGISSLTTQVSQGITTVLESGIGAPDPEELARRPAPNHASSAAGRPAEGPPPDQGNDGAKTPQTMGEGLVHLEALELVSRQAGLRVQGALRAAQGGRRDDLEETLRQVEELCELSENEDDEDGDGEGDGGDGEVASGPCEQLHHRLQKATEDLGVKLQFQPLVKHYEEVLTLLQETTTPDTLYRKAVESLAQATALAMELYHKAGEMLMVKPRRSTACEADSLSQMTAVLVRHVGHLARQFTEKLNANGPAHTVEGRDITIEYHCPIDNYVTNVFLEAENSCRHLRDALLLELPIVQIGAI